MLLKFVMNRILLFIVSLCIVNIGCAQVSVCSWNLEDFGGTKNNAEIDFIANTLKNYDVILIQEVVAKDSGGEEAVIRLNNALNTKGSQWSYIVSDITSGSAYKSERYAFIWKAQKLTMIGKAWLEKKYKTQIERKHYFCILYTS